MLKGKKLLVTGLTGNLGGSIAYALAPHNEVWGLARYTRSGQREYWTDAGVRTVVGDCGVGGFAGLPDDFEYVIHAAAAIHDVTFESGMRDNAEGSALLMAHCRKARAFMHISTLGVYAQNPDPNHKYREDDLTGSAVTGHYQGTKLAAEGAVRAMSRHLGLPTVIGRLGVQYGTFYRGGLPGLMMKAILEKQPVLLPKAQGNLIQPISDDDVVEFLEPLLNAATVPALIVNLAGDEVISTQAMAEHIGKLAGLKPEIVYSDALNYPTHLVDGTRRQQITGPCKVPLREGLTRMYKDVLDKQRVEKFSEEIWKSKEVWNTSMPRAK